MNSLKPVDTKENTFLYLYVRKRKLTNNDFGASDQSHNREVPQWEIFMEQELRFGPSLLQNLLTYDTILYNLLYSI